MINYRVIDVANGAEPTEHEALEEAIAAAKKIDYSENDPTETLWFIEDWRGEVVWSVDNER